MLFNKKPDGPVRKKPEEPMREAPAKRPAAAVVPGVEPNPAVRKQGGAPTRSVIDAWLTITGNLESEGEVQVDGQIYGDIGCAHLTVGRDATVEGNVTADEVVVRGNVKGVIRANRVILQDSAHVESTVYHKKISIEEGGSFEGRSARCDDPMSAELEQPAAPELKAMAAEMRSVQKANGKPGNVAEAAVG